LLCAGAARGINSVPAKQLWARAHNSDPPCFMKYNSQFNANESLSAILAELHMFERCDRVQKVVAFIGLAPRQFISGSSLKGKPRLSKIGHARLRKTLYMPAQVSIQCNPIIQTFYHRLKKKE
jgi:hypothetical protein